MRKMRNSLGYKIHGLIFSLFSAVYPSVCPECKNPSDTFSCAPLCKGCWQTIMRYSGPACKVCAAPLISEYSTVCAECFSRPPHFSRVIDFGLYSGALSEAIHLLKFSGLRRLAGPLGKFLSELPIDNVDGIVPVPVTKKTLQKRGFNQTLLLSKRIAEHFKIPLRMDILLKERDTLPQTGLGAKERKINVKNAFRVKGEVEGMRLLLLDDVMTTGATVRECSKALHKAGAEEVIVVTLARSAPN